MANTVVILFYRSFVDIFWIACSLNTYKNYRVERALQKHLFEPYQKIIREYKKLSLRYERKLIVLAQKGNLSAQSELLLHLVGFFLFRIKTTLYPSIVKQYGEDILQDCLYMAIKKIGTYNLRYKSKIGELQPVHLSTYMWKSITGLMLTFVKTQREVCFSDLANRDTRKYE